MAKKVKTPLTGVGRFIPDNYFRRWKKEEIFTRDAPLEIDLGCGDGSFLIEMAKNFPERNFLGIERLNGRIKKVARKIEREKLTNAKVLRLESKYTIEWLLEKASISRLHLLCPDPWPKLKHHERRLVQQDFLESVWQLLEKNGEFLFKTDHDEYYDWVITQVNQFKKFLLTPWQEGTFFYPKTDFQLLWESEGRRLQSLHCIKSSI
jgi:tRNA (guanine-N7-)-methyltransferase